MLECWWFKTHYSHGLALFTAAGFLPDKILTTLTSNTHIRTVDDMINILQPTWIYAWWHGQEVLDLLSGLDKAEKSDCEQAKLAKRELRKKETVERQNENKWQKMLECAQAHHLKTMPQQQSWQILDGLLSFNIIHQVSNVHLIYYLHCAHTKL